MILWWRCPWWTRWVWLSSACVIELSSCEPLCPLTHCVIYALRSSRNLRVWECLKMPNYSGEFSRTARSSTRWRMTWIYRNNMLKRPDRYTAWKKFFYVRYNSLFFPPSKFHLFICTILRRKKNTLLLWTILVAFFGKTFSDFMPFAFFKFLFRHFACIKQIRSLLLFALWMEKDFIRRKILKTFKNFSQIFLHPSLMSSKLVVDSDMFCMYIYFNNTWFHHIFETISKLWQYSLISQIPMQFCSLAPNNELKTHNYYIKCIL